MALQVPQNIRRPGLQRALRCGDWPQVTRASADGLPGRTELAYGGALRSTLPSGQGRSDCHLSRGVCVRLVVSSTPGRHRGSHGGGKEAYSAERTTGWGHIQHPVHPGLGSLKRSVVHWRDWGINRDGDVPSAACPPVVPGRLNCVAPGAGSAHGTTYRPRLRKPRAGRLRQGASHSRAL
jgi:hypothetical protein